MAGLVSRCCGGAWIGWSRTPSSGKALGRKGRLGVLSAVCGLVLAVPVATARAEDPPPPPLPPTVPTIAVQVSVSIPSVSVNVQVGNVAVSVSTAPVDVSVSVPSRSTSRAPSRPLRLRSRRHRTRLWQLLQREAKAVAPVDAAVRPSRPARASSAAGGLSIRRPRRQRRPRVHTRSLGHGSFRRCVRRPRARRREPRASGGRGRAGPRARCCKSAPAAVVVAAAPTRVALPPAVKLPLDRVQRAGWGRLRFRGAGAGERQSPAPPIGSAGGVPLPGVPGGMVLRHEAEAEEGMSARTRR